MFEFLENILLEDVEDQYLCNVGVSDGLCLHG